MSHIKKIGKRLKYIRTEANIKQKDLAKELNIPAPQLSIYEQGKREPSISFLLKFCNYFHISLSQFFIFLDDITKNKESADIENILKDLDTKLKDLEKINFSNFNNK